MTEEISSLETVLRESVGSYRVMLGTNVAALRYMKREIDERKEAKMIQYDMTVFDSSGSNAGGNITYVGGDDGKGEKDKKDKDLKKRKGTINVGNGNVSRQRK
jgi:hypothetical protein